jgi:hypothetical protein
MTTDDQKLKLITDAVTEEALETITNKWWDEHHMPRFGDAKTNALLRMAFMNGWIACEEAQGDALRDLQEALAALDNVPHTVTMGTPSRPEAYTFTAPEFCANCGATLAPTATSCDVCGNLPVIGGRL